jgi:membrane-associated phospholipid phosphatase
MACLAALLPPKHKGWQIAFLIIGIGVAYSRIYLSCHFLEDTLLGALIGTIAAAITYGFMYKSEWGDRPIYRLR